MYIYEKSEEKSVVCVRERKLRERRKTVLLTCFAKKVKDYISSFIEKKLDPDAIPCLSIEVANECLQFYTYGRVYIRKEI